MYIVVMAQVADTHLCSICQSTVLNAVFHCPASCVFHKDCIHNWIETCKKNRNPVLCPNCRQEGTHGGLVPINEVLKLLEIRIKELTIENFGLKQTVTFLNAKQGNFIERTKPLPTVSTPRYPEQSWV